MKKCADKTVSLRMTREEYDALMRMAETDGCGLSAEIRKRLFSPEKERKDVLSEADARRKIHADLAQIRLSFRKAVAQITGISDIYSNSVSVRNSKGEPAVNTSLTDRSFRGIARELVRLQDVLNEFLGRFGAAEIHEADVPEDEYFDVDAGGFDEL